LSGWSAWKLVYKTIKGDRLENSLYLFVLPFYQKLSLYIYICFITFIVYHHYYFNKLDHSDVGILVLFGTLAGLLRSYYYKSRLGRRIFTIQLHEASYL